MCFSVYTTYIVSEERRREGRDLGWEEERRKREGREKEERRCSSKMERLYVALCLTYLTATILV